MPFYRYLLMKMMLILLNKLFIINFESMQTPKFICIVDDNTIALFLAKQVIRIVFPEAELVLFESSKKAYDYLTSQESHIPDLLITDLQMPIYTGIDLITRIKQFYKESDKEVPYLILLNSDSYDIHHIWNQNRDLPIHACIPKPLTTSKIKDIFNMRSEYLNLQNIGIV
jgi:CheY-like chemotaxis protein